MHALATSNRLGTPASPWEGVFKRTRSSPGFKSFAREQGLEAYWRATGEWGDFCPPVGQNDFECR